jgi:hypothetical protein
MQVLYPVGLAAAIFSMQQEAIPFKQSPRSFVITVVMLIIIVYATLLFGKYALPPLARRILAFWVNKPGEAGEFHKVGAGKENEEATQPMKGPDLGKALGDEEQMLERACGTRALLGPTARKQGTDFGG